jgi:hypothetical protein
MNSHRGHRGSLKFSILDKILTVEWSAGLEAEVRYGVSLSTNFSMDVEEIIDPYMNFILEPHLADV